MSHLNTVLLWTLLLLIFQIRLNLTEDDSDSDDSDVCLVNEDGSSTCNVDNNNKILTRLPDEPLGKYLLRKNELLYSSIGSKDTRPMTSMQIRMVNPNNKMYDVYWYNKHRNPSRIFKGPIKPYSARSTNSYIGHVWIWTEHNASPQDEIWRFNVVPNVNLYVMPPENENDKYYQEILEKKRFYENYEKQTGDKWIVYYPRPKPKLHIWSVDEGVGFIHKIITKQMYWKCIPDDFYSPHDVKKCRSRGSMELGVEIISQSPRIFIIEDVISDIEAEMVIKLATDKLQRSRAGGDGGMEDNTRTSRTAWLDRTEHPIMDTIYRRAADVLKVDEKILYSNKNVESLQVVHYNTGQEYKAHYDFGDHGVKETRLITLLFYLNDMIDDESGGSTLFPKANNNKGVNVHPGKGNAVLFYDLLPDGNGDHKSLHEAVRLLKGEKWICNFWVWDPSR